MRREGRINPEVPTRQVSLPNAFMEREWKPVDEATFEYGRLLRLHATNSKSPPLLEFREVLEPGDAPVTVTVKVDVDELAAVLKPAESPEPPPPSDPASESETDDPDEDDAPSSEKSPEPNAETAPKLTKAERRAAAKNETPEGSTEPTQ